MARHLQRIEHTTELVQWCDIRLESLKLGIDKPHIKRRVVNNQLRALNELREFSGDFFEGGLTGEKFERNAMHLQCAGVNVALRDGCIDGSDGL